MRTRVLRSGIQLSELGLGVAQFGNLYRETSDDEAAGAVDAAWAAGIRYFDTAPHYGLGLSERRLGACLAGRPREQFVLSTKVGRLLRPVANPARALDTEGFVVPADFTRELDYSADGVRRSLECSMERLGVDHIDIVYIHDPDEHWEQASTEAVPALVELREQGVIGAIGAGMNQSAMLADFVERCDVDIVMVAGRYTLLEQGALDDLLPLALERQVGVVVAGVYNSGLLSSRRPASDARYDYDPAPAALVQRANAIADICEAHGVSLPQAAIALSLRHPAVVSAVLGARTVEQVNSNVERYAAAVPDELWPALVDAGLLREDAAG